MTPRRARRTGRAPPEPIEPNRNPNDPHTAYKDRYMAEVSGSYLIARTLKEEGVEALFFLMGGPNYEIVNYFEDFGIRTIDFRHEQAAAFAAHVFIFLRRSCSSSVESRNSRPETSKAS